MKILVLGASSQIGRFLLPRLRARGDEVVAVSRWQHADSDGLTWLRGELPDRMPDIAHVDAVICYGPIIVLAPWLASGAAPGVTRVVCTSSMSAQSKLDSPDAVERELSRSLRDGETMLAAACEARGIAWTVLRPTLVYGAGIDKSLSPIARGAMRAHVFPLPSGRGLRQPVHADDIACASVAALDTPAAAGQVIPVGGGERLTSGEMFARVRRSLAVATLPLPVPRWLLGLAAAAIPRARGPISRLDVDLVADNEPLLRLLGVRPRPFLADGACWMPS
ncbi:MAG TPA: NAD-dependent epimerase/dehydratase family protein [Pinirhizobacter sp.]|uniref:SDR family oxidoreductase n=1 Tax=Pinirhizobacter sp. TaxID=2950432 RepID=UPI002C84D564|nr:NAD-dependent epimerase/dehydratase family protein [Pinirhizobacter sp.]HMH67533.1 NAD-dependent epimerase/dehydratase family protein [Pinirhizobacter sp.]